MTKETDYGENSVAAVMRVLVLASSVRGEVKEATMKALRAIIEQKGLSVDALVRIIAEYERDVEELSDRSAKCFEGRSHLPQALLNRAIDAVTDNAVQLDLAALMVRLFTAGDTSHLKEEVLFVEYCVARWGIREEWHAYLNDNP